MEAAMEGNGRRQCRAMVAMAATAVIGQRKWQKTDVRKQRGWKIDGIIRNSIFANRKL